MQAKKDTSIMSRVDPLENERQRVEQRRQRLEDRRKRILDVKKRIIGIDKDALDAQVEERRAKEAFEKKQQLRGADQEREFNQIAGALEAEKARLAAQDRVTLRAYHEAQAQLRKEQEGRERARELADRSFDAPLLSFRGEDPSAKTREAALRSQQREWLSSQMEGKRGAEATARQALSREHEESVRLLVLAKEQEQRIAALRTEHEAELANFNRVQLEAKRQREQEAKATEAKQSQAEIEFQLSNAFMTEAFDSTLRAGNPARYIPYNFKGMSHAQRSAIVSEQQRQVEELEQRRRAERQTEAEAAARAEAARKEALRLQKQAAEAKARDRRALQSELVKQKLETDARWSYMNGVVYTNPVAETYFEQFGTSAR